MTFSSDRVSPVSFLNANPNRAIFLLLIVLNRAATILLTKRRFWKSFISTTWHKKVDIMNKNAEKILSKISDKLQFVPNMPLCAHACACVCVCAVLFSIQLQQKVTDTLLFRHGLSCLLTIHLLHAPSWKFQIFINHNNFNKILLHPTKSSR